MCRDCKHTDDRIKNSSREVVIALATAKVVMSVILCGLSIALTNDGRVALGQTVAPLWLHYSACLCVIVSSTYVLYSGMMLIDILFFDGPCVDGDDGWL